MSTKKYKILFLMILFLLGTVANTVAIGQHHAPADIQKAIGHEPRAMSLGQAAVLGLVEGLTEYLPVSSTGHLLIAGRLLGIGHAVNPTSTTEAQKARAASDAYAICIQAGAIIAVLGLYFRRIRQILAGLVGKDPLGRRLLINIIAGFLPAAVMGLTFEKLIKAYLFGPWPIAAAWLAGGIAILVLDRHYRKNAGWPHDGTSLDDLTWRTALIIGVIQCLAMCPGVSRSLVTIVGGLLAGLSMSAAVEYSFLLGVVTLGAATGFDALEHGRLILQTFDALPVAVGLLFAFIAAVVSVKWMVAYLNRRGLAIFGWYRIALGLLVPILITTRVI